MVMKDSEFYRSITRPRDSRFYMSIQGVAGMMVSMWVRPKRKVSDAEAIKFLVQRYKNIVGGLGDKGQWRHALSVVKWVYSSKEHKHFKSRCSFLRFVVTFSLFTSLSKSSWAVADGAGEGG
ncbi:hypothetical protein Hanom_Chr11g01050051 [Helianthus anomalus]